LYENINTTDPQLLLTGTVDPKDLSYTPPLTKVEKQELETKKKSSDF